MYEVGQHAAPERQGIKTWLLWLSASLAGMLLSGALSTVLTRVVVAAGASAQTFAIISLSLISPITSAALGLCQALVLRRVLPFFRLGYWVAATAIGSVLGNLATVLINYVTLTGINGMFDAGVPYQRIVLFALLTGAIGGLIVGLAQALVLRRYLAAVIAWVAASMLGAALSSAIWYALLTPGVRAQGPSALGLTSNFAASMLGVLAHAGLTGAALIWLINRAGTDNPSTDP